MPNSTIQNQLMAIEILARGGAPPVRRCALRARAAVRLVRRSVAGSVTAFARECLRIGVRETTRNRAPWRA